MSRTFTNLGIPFPLFEAPVEEASGYSGLGRCSLCGNTKRHCFELGIGDQVVVTCERCGAENALDADDRLGGACANCGSEVEFPKEITGSVTVCYECLRAGRAAIVKDTALGMVDWEQANASTTPDAREALFELLRTPNYPTWQGEQWQYCHGKPMVYVGPWSQQDFEQHAPDGDGRALFLEVVDDTSEDLWEDGEMAAAIMTYMFRCSVCGRYKGHWDTD